MTDWIRGLYRETETYKKRHELEKEFAAIINKYSLENDSNTPDFILARCLVDSLINFQLTIAERSAWYNPNGANTRQSFDQVKREVETLMKDKRIIVKSWNKSGFWQYSCGCVQFQDSFELCCEHESGGYPSLLAENIIDRATYSGWEFRLI